VPSAVFLNVPLVNILFVLIVSLVMPPPFHSPASDPADLLRPARCIALPDPRLHPPSVGSDGLRVFNQLRVFVCAGKLSSVV